MNIFFGKKNKIKKIKKNKKIKINK